MVEEKTQRIPDQSQKHHHQLRPGSPTRLCLLTSDIVNHSIHSFTYTIIIPNTQLLQLVSPERVCLITLKTLISYEYRRYEPSFHRLVPFLVLPF